MKTFIVSDTHFGHHSFYNGKFRKSDGSIVRPFASVEEADTVMVERWNTVVGPEDKVYHLGDVAIPRKSLKTLESLNGRKVLIRGNHDIHKLADYAKYFKDVRAFHVLNGCVFTHAPLHPMSLGKFGCNVHGHTHSDIVRRQSEIGGMERDSNYLNVCVEHTGYTPLTLDEVFARIVAQGGTVGFLEVRRQQVSTEE